MKRIILWVVAATLVCGLTVCTACSNDDNTDTAAPATDGKLVTLPQGVVSKGCTMLTTRIVNTVIGEQTTYEKKNVQVAFDGQDVYVSGLSASFPESFVKGTLTGNGTCRFKSGQYVGEDKTGEKYVVGITGDKTYQLADIECTYDAEMRILAIPVEGATCAVAESVSPSSAEVSNILRSVTVMPGSFKEPAVVTPPEGLATEQWYVTGENQDDNGLNYGMTVAFDGQEVYIQGFFKEQPLTWLHGRLENGIITIEKGQFLGYYDKWQEVSFHVDNDDGKMSDMKLTYDAEKGIMETEDCACMYDLDMKQAAYIIYHIYITRQRYILPDPMFPPASATVKAYRFESENIEPIVETPEGEEEAERDSIILDEVLFAFDGSDVYMKIYTVNAKGWAKGRFSADGTTITFPAHQYIGTLVTDRNHENYFLTGFVDKGTYYEDVDIVLDYDAEDGSIRSRQSICVCGSHRRVDPFADNMFGSAVFTLKKDVPATPTAPQIDINFNSLRNILALDLKISLFAEDGTDLMAEKLTYKIWYEKDGQPHEYFFQVANYEELTTDMAEVPFFFGTIHEFVMRGRHVEVHAPLSELIAWTKVGAQTIYRGGGEVHTSDIAWFETASYYEEIELAH